MGKRETTAKHAKEREKVTTKERLEELVLEGLASPVREMTEADWQELKRRAQNRIESKLDTSQKSRRLCSNQDIR